MITTVSHSATPVPSRQQVPRGIRHRETTESVYWVYLTLTYWQLTTDAETPCEAFWEPGRLQRFHFIILIQGPLFQGYFNLNMNERWVWWVMRCNFVTDKDQLIHLSGSLINSQNDQVSWVQYRNIIKDITHDQTGNLYEAKTLPLCNPANCLMSSLESLVASAK
jgi:hypothetical protein